MMFAPPPTRVPAELRPFTVTAGERTGTIPVGFPGKVGVADLALAPDRDGRTGFTDRYIKAPMYVSKPLYIDPGDTGEAFVYLRSTGGGLAANDRMRQRVVCGAGAQVAVTTQAATPVHRMDEGMAVQWTTLDVGAGAACEYVPGQTILFGGSRLLQITDAVVEPGGALLASDILLTGRLARGERNEFDALGQVWTIRRPRNGRAVPLLSDTLCVTGPEAESEMLLSRYAVWGTVLAVPADPATVPGLVTELRAMSYDEVAVGVSTLVDEAGVMVRVAGNDPVAVNRAMDRTYGAVRTHVMGRPTIDLRRM